VRYNPALDGVRAIAITLVFATHFYESAMPGGWIGVDVFFVLSGYLITSVLLHELRQSGGISLFNFYMRRMLRLTPALALLALFQFARSPFSHNGWQVREATLIGAAYLENWNKVFEFGSQDLMGHTWSLAIEEQFYWLWPLTLLFLVKRHPLIWITPAFAAMAVARFVLWRDGYAATTVQYCLFIRPVGLLVGCILAFLPIDRWRPPALIAPAALIALLALGLFAEKSIYAFLAAPLAASLATAALIISLQSARTVTKGLSLSPIRYTGKISYGLYLYHLPIISLGLAWKAHTPFHAVPYVIYAAGLIVLSFAIAALSFEFVEKPFLRLKDRFQGNREPRQQSELVARVA
jgi:peptidoglycan/LPS O-acetylase OafA/YrhL